MPELIMTFDPRTIEHLGVKMYSTLPPAIAELIANAYDACATEVYVKLYDSPKRIEVIDDGIGMTFGEINTNFLRIGRNRREEEQKPPCTRFPTGKKGLGKLALFGIGKSVEVITKKEGKKISFVMEWDDIMETEGDYKPDFKIEDCEPEDKGTTIIVHHLKRKTNFIEENMGKSISKLFNFADTDFIVKLQVNDHEPINIDRDLKFSGIDKEFEWEAPEVFDLIEEEYKYEEYIRGHLFSTPKPLTPGLRGITLYANGRMVNLPEFFGVTESSHFFSYLTGYLEINFIDEWEEDVISTDRQSLDWENEKLEELRAFLQIFLRALERDWRKLRKEKRKRETRETTGINTEEWFRKTPNEVKSKLEVIVDNLTEESELPAQKQKEVLEAVHSLVPEYPYYHWRHLHKSIKKVSEEDYQRADYLRAANEAVTEYENIVEQISRLTGKKGVDLMNQSFGSNWIMP